MPESPPAVNWERLLSRISADLNARGYDLVHPFNVDWVRDGVLERGGLPGFARPGALGVLVANSRALWPRFLDELTQNPSLLLPPHPLDAYTEQSVCQAFTRLETAVPQYHLRYAHDTDPILPIQRVATDAGLSVMAPCHLSLHPRLGPWFALRAVILLDIAGPKTPPSPPQSPCDECHQPCLPALRTAIQGGAPYDEAEPATWRPWLAVRDACPVGRRHRYPEAQIDYHYGKSKHVLASHGAEDDPPPKAR